MCVFTLEDHQGAVEVVVFPEMFGRHRALIENGAPVIGPGGLPEARLAFCRADQLTVEDTWHTHGLRGSGSNHYRAEGVFIPEDQALRIEEAMFAGRDPLYSSGFNWVTTMAAVPLGTARRALDEANDRAVADGVDTVPAVWIDGRVLAGERAIPA